MWGQILGAVLPALIGSSSGGSQESGNDSQISKQLEEYIGNMLQNGMPQYEGQTNIDMPDIYEQLMGNISGQLNGEGLGMSQNEMDMMYNQQKTQLDDARQQGVSNTIEGMNSRGILPSDITGNNLRGISKNYADALADSSTNIQLQNANMKRNQKNNAMNMGANLGQWQTGIDQFNTNTGLNNFYNQQNLNQMPYQMGMDYLTGYEAPDKQNKQRQNNQNSAMWGNAAGTVFNALPWF